MSEGTGGATGPASGFGGEGPVAIIGLGVLGGSIARAIRQVDPAVELLGVEVDPVVAARALELGVVDRVDPSGEDLLHQAATVVFAAPLAQLPGFLAGPGQRIPASALITDVVALNQPVLGRAAREGLEGRWVTAGPNLVTADTGLATARPDAFHGVEVRLSVSDALAGDEGEGVRVRIEGFWTALGASVLWMDPREHDALVCWTVLLPRLLASGLAGALHAAGVPGASLGPDARAMVALAGTDASRWEELLEAGAQVTGTGLTSVSRAMQVVADLLASRHVERIAEFMERSRGWVLEGAGGAERSGTSEVTP